MKITSKPVGARYLELTKVLKDSVGKVDFQPYASKWSLQPFLDRSSDLSADERTWLTELEEKLKGLSSSPDARQVPLSSEEMQQLMRFFFPPFKASFKLGALVRPLAPTELIVTEDWFKLLSSGHMKVGEPTKHSLAGIRAGMTILNQHYQQDLEQAFNDIIDYHDESTKLVSHYRVHSGYDFVNVIVHGEKPYLRSAEIRQLLSNPEDGEMWIAMLPPKHFSFEGIEINHVIDATEEIAKGRLQQLLLKREAVLSPKRVTQLRDTLRNYLRVPDLRLGVMALDYPDTSVVSHRYLIRQDLLAAKIVDVLDSNYGPSIYRETCEHGTVRIYDDLRDCREENGELENEILELGFKSIVLVPLFGRKKNIIGMLELASKKAYAFNSLVLYQLEGIAPLFRQALRRSRNDMEARIQSVMRKNFTALDPSVEWRFTQAAVDIIEREQHHDEDHLPAEQIRFEKVWALYAQADIVGSSKLRNEAIRTDLINDLLAAKTLLENPAVALRFPLAGKLVFDIQELLAAIHDDMSPNQEQKVLEFLAFSFRPTLQQLSDSSDMAGRIAQYKQDREQAYIEGLSRKDAYEKSLRKVTRVVNQVITSGQVEAQRIVPHYFNKYRTDGIEFNIYAGQSLLQTQSFTEVHLHNLRLWQLQTMIDVTKAISGLKHSLLIPMETAQLILAFGNTITIQFRMDEKRFDVEGAYNVRYEVIKKRIDKAKIRGTEERLTQANHVSIVYSHHSDRKIYEDLIEYLHGVGQVATKAEHVDLEPMQGVDGLSALRFRVM